MFTFGFKHLKEINQTYFQHLYDAITYATMSFGAGFCFIIHAIYPDLLVWNGGLMVEKTHLIIQNKKKMLNVVRKE